MGRVIACGIPQGAEHEENEEEKGCILLLQRDRLILEDKMIEKYETMDNNNSLVQISQAVEIIKTAILQSQERTIRNANADVLALNYAVGGFISQQSKLHQWGSGIIKSISEKLQRDLPGLRGFGYENLKKMRQFYESWTPYIIGSPTATQLQESEIGSPVATQIALPKLQMSFASSAQEIESAHDFLSISFSHHMEILNKTSTLEER